MNPAQQIERRHLLFGGRWLHRRAKAIRSMMDRQRAPVPYPFQERGDAAGTLVSRHAMPIWAIMLENEKAWHTEDEIRAYVRRIWDVMQACVQRGLATEGILPGGLNVRRRAKRWYCKLQERRLAPIRWRRWTG